MEDRTAVTTAVMSLNPSPCLDSRLRAAHCGSTDMQHLQRLSPAYVTDVDALLSVVMTDSETPVEFPVHAAILSEHSPIMRDLLQATRDEQNAMASGKEPHIAKIVVPMVGDTVLEVQALLAAVYASKAVKAATPQQVVDSARPYHALTAAHKYGMAKLLQELESQLISEVTDLKKSSCSTGALKIIAYACAADKCHLERLTAHSEAYIVERFDQLGDTELWENLSSRSLYRIALGRGASFRLKLRELTNTLTKSCSEFETALIQAHRAEEVELSCPRLCCKGDVEVLKVSKKRRIIRCNGKQCTWPEPVL